jgi:hypothetical protein
MLAPSFDIEVTMTAGLRRTTTAAAIGIEAITIATVQIRRMS